MTRVSNYDLFDYDYSTYWSSRNYEHQAEVHLLNKLFQSQHGDWFLDIGGSYGRLASVYYDKYKHPVVLDYSLKTLQRNYITLKKIYPNLILIAANAYHLPFKDNSFDGALMVRVLHHILEPDQYFKELYRALNPSGYYVQEFANKINLKARIKALLHFNWSIFSESPYQQPTASNFEGTKQGEQTIFRNYHPQYIKKLLTENHFEIYGKHGCSYLRSQKIKKVIGEKMLLRIEYFLQNLLPTSNIPPSLVYNCKAIKSEKENNKYRNLEEILACPKCGGNLTFNDSQAQCCECKTMYNKKSNIWDFRID